MAAFPPIRVRDLDPPESVVPREIWRQLVKRVGGLIVARPGASRLESGSIKVEVDIDDQALEVVKRILLELDSDAWERDPDWWKG